MAPICDGRRSDFFGTFLCHIWWGCPVIENDEVRVRSVPSPSQAHRQVALQDEMGCHNAVVELLAFFRGAEQAAAPDVVS